MREERMITCSNDDVDSQPVVEKVVEREKGRKHKEA